MPSQSTAEKHCDSASEWHSAAGLLRLPMAWKSSEVVQAAYLMAQSIPSAFKSGDMGDFLVDYPDDVKIHYASSAGRRELLVAGAYPKDVLRVGAFAHYVGGSPEVLAHVASAEPLGVLSVGAQGVKCLSHRGDILTFDRQDLVSHGLYGVAAGKYESADLEVGFTEDRAPIAYYGDNAYPVENGEAVVWEIEEADDQDPAVQALLHGGDQALVSHLSATFKWPASWVTRVVSNLETGAVSLRVVLPEGERGRLAPWGSAAYSGQIHNMSANEIEQRFRQGLLEVKDVEEWCRLSAKGSAGRIYIPYFTQVSVQLKRLDVDYRGNDVPPEVWQKNPDYVKLMKGETLWNSSASKSVSALGFIDIVGEGDAETPDYPAIQNTPMSVQQLQSLVPECGAAFVARGFWPVAGGFSIALPTDKGMTKGMAAQAARDRLDQIINERRASKAVSSAPAFSGSAITSPGNMVNYQGKVMSFGDLMKDGLITSKQMRQRDFNRTKFNRMEGGLMARPGQDPQQKYMAGLKNSRTYWAELGPSSYEVSATIYKQLDVPEKPFKDQYWWVDEQGREIPGAHAKKAAELQAPEASASMAVSAYGPAVPIEWTEKVARMEGRAYRVWTKPYPKGSGVGGPSGRGRLGYSFDGGKNVGRDLNEAWQVASEKYPVEPAGEAVSAGTIPTADQADQALITQLLASHEIDVEEPNMWVTEDGFIISKDTTDTGRDDTQEFVVMKGDTVIETAFTYTEAWGIVKDAREHPELFSL